MILPVVNTIPSQPLSVVRLVDRVCLQFEDEWRARRRPRIEDHLGGVGQEAHDRLLRELLLIDWQRRLLAGERPRVEEYLARFPAHPGLIASAFSGPNDGLTLPQQFRRTGGFATGYEVLEELGRGATGVVYRARQLTLGRVVAVKMLLAGALASRQACSRFTEEARAASRLQHPNIVQLYEVGEADGRPFLALEYVEGQSLERRLRTSTLPPQDAARLVLELARAMHYAHEHGVIHRDLKPANILLAPASGRDDATWVPKITDFGMAKQLEEENGHTRTGDVVGTPSYMAPEQAEGLSKTVGPAADVWALGAILYECLTGRPPFKAATVLDTLEQVRSANPVLPRELHKGLSRDLEAVCLKCLEKEPRRRYRTAAELADDLGRFLGHEPTTARDTGLLERLTRAVERHRPGREIDKRSWARLFTWLIPLVFASHLTIFVVGLVSLESLDVWMRAIRVGQVAAMVGLYVVHRWPKLVPGTVTERLLLSLFFGHGAACMLVQVVVSWMAPPGWTDLNLYPIWSLLTSLMLFVIGSFWSRAYISTAAFCVAGLLMPLLLPAAPLVYGLMWCVVMLAARGQLMNLDREHRARQDA